MGTEPKICSHCGAANRIDAPWCARCYTRFEDDPDEVRAPTVAPARSRWVRVIALGVLIAFALSFGVATLLSALREDDAVTRRGLADAAGFRFIQVDGDTGEPVRFDPCRELHWVFNPTHAPAGAARDVRAAADVVAQGSGLALVYDGITDEPVELRRPAHQPGRYGDRWAPILIGWFPQDSAIFSHDSVGVGGSEARANRNGSPVFVTGSIVLNATEHLDNGFGAGKTWGKVLIHEWGHVLGLDHVENPAQVMHPDLVSSPAVWGNGDLAGLRLLGPLSGCVAVPEP